MAAFRDTAAAVAVFVAFASGHSPALANGLGTMTDIPFWGKPYPHYYVYDHRRPNDRCIVYRPIWTWDGTTVERVWVCPPPVIGRRTGPFVTK